MNRKKGRNTALHIVTSFDLEKKNNASLNTILHGSWEYILRGDMLEDCKDGNGLKMSKLTPRLSGGIPCVVIVGVDSRRQSLYSITVVSCVHFYIYNNIMCLCFFYPSLCVIQCSHCVTCWAFKSAQSVLLCSCFESETLIFVEMG